MHKNRLIVIVALLCIAVVSTAKAGLFDKLKDRIGSKSFPQVIPALEVCNRARKSEVLQRYLQLTSRIHKEYFLLSYPHHGIYDESAALKIDFRLEGFDPDHPWLGGLWGGSGAGSGERFFNNQFMVRDWMSAVYKEKAKKVNFGFDASWHEKQNKEIQECAKEMRGTDEFRLFTASGPNYAQYAGGCSDSGDLFCEAQKRECKRVLNASGMLEKVCEEDTLKYIGGFHDYLDSEERDGSFWRNGLLLYLLVIDGGDNVLSGLGNEILDSWEKRLPGLITKVQARLDADYANIYSSFGIVKICYDMRKGHDRVYISDFGFNRAKESFAARKRNLGISADAAMRVERKVEEKLSAMRLKSVNSSYSKGDKKLCEEELSSLGSARL